MSQEDTIQLDIQHQVARVFLNRPANLNSFNAEMHQNLSDVLDQIAADTSIRAMLLSGNGKGFCAGQDLSDPGVMPGNQNDLSRIIGERYNPLVLKLRALTIPTVCAVHGVAAGAGANIALHCDLVIAGKRSRFIQAFCKIGLIPDSGGTWLLPRLVGQQRAMGLALLGDSITGEIAEQWGLIWRSFEDASLLEEADKLCQHLATQPTRGLALIKQAMAASWQNSLPEQLDLEKDLQKIAGRSDDYAEGVRAFTEKRPPDFSGN